MDIFDRSASGSCVFPDLYCERTQLIEINVTFPWLSTLNTFSSLAVAVTCVSFLTVYSLIGYAVMHLCERRLRSSFWRLFAYIAFMLVFFASFTLALFVFPQDKVLVIVLFFSYNLLKIGYGAYKSSVPSKMG